jgi:hypothetical protein
MSLFENYDYGCKEEEEEEEEEQVLVCHFENFNFLHLEIPVTREKRVPGQSGVVGVIHAKASATVGVCVAFILNSKTTSKEWAPVGFTTDCLVLLFGHQRKCPRRQVVRILQREKETVQTRVGLVAVTPIIPAI